MHILVHNATTRCAVVIQGTATVRNLKEKVAAQTRKGSTIEWPVDEQELRRNNEVLCDEMTLVEHNVVDRDRIELRRLGGSSEADEALAAQRRAAADREAQILKFSAVAEKNRKEAEKQGKGGHVLGGGGGGGAAASDGGAGAKEAVVRQLLSAAELLAKHEQKVIARQPVHEEYFTQLLERLDGITLDGLSDADRDDMRAKRKELVRRVEQVSALAAKVS